MPPFGITTGQSHCVTPLNPVRTTVHRTICTCVDDRRPLLYFVTSARRQGQPGVRRALAPKVNFDATDSFATILPPFFLSLSLSGLASVTNTGQSTCPFSSHRVPIECAHTLPLCGCTAQQCDAIRPIPKRLSGFVKGGTRASQHV